MIIELASCSAHAVYDKQYRIYRTNLILLLKITFSSLKMSNNKKIFHIVSADYNHSKAKRYRRNNWQATNWRTKQQESKTQWWDGESMTLMTVFIHWIIEVGLHQVPQPPITFLNQNETWPICQNYVFWKSECLKWNAIEENAEVYRRE